MVQIKKKEIIMKKTQYFFLVLIFLLSACSSNRLIQNEDYNTEVIEFFFLEKIETDSLLIPDIKKFIPPELSVINDTIVFPESLKSYNSTLEIEIKKDGTIEDIAILADNDSSFTDLFIQEIKKWRFIPASDSSGTFYHSWIVLNSSDFFKTFCSPKLKKIVSPDYPIKDRENFVKGSVVLSVEVLKDGSVGDVIIKKYLHPDLEKSAIKALKQSRFEPARIAGIPITMRITFPVIFSLD